MWMRTEERIDEDSIGLKAMLAGFAPPLSPCDDIWRG